LDLEHLREVQLENERELHVYVLGDEKKAVSVSCSVLASALVLIAATSSVESAQQRKGG
jgi:hypothetical protein